MTTRTVLRGISLLAGILLLLAARSVDPTRPETRSVAVADDAPRAELAALDLPALRRAHPRP